MDAKNEFYTDLCETGCILYLQQQEVEWVVKNKQWAPKVKKVSITNKPLPVILQQLTEMMMVVPLKT